HNKVGSSHQKKKRLLVPMTVSYAVTYIFGTAGTAWILSALGPRLVGGNVTAACREYEAGMSGNAADGPEIPAACRQAGLGTYRLTADLAADTTIDEFESEFLRPRVFEVHP